jgi:predicted nucleic acid-binding protein
VSALVVDTSSWIAYFAGDGSPLIEDALGSGTLLLPVVVASELLSGKMNRADRVALEDLLDTLPACGIERAHWFRVGSLRRQLAAKGLSVSTPDAHVAQCAIDAGARLLSEDRTFRKIAAHAPLRLAES